MNVVFYHKDCADGFAAATVAYMVLGDDTTFVPVQYGDEVPDVTGKVVYMVDFSVPPETLTTMAATAKRITIIDHHKSAIEKYDGYAKPDNVNLELNEERSGAWLAHQYFFPDDIVPDIIRLIDDRDRWQFRLDGSKDLNRVLFARRPWNFAQWAEWIVDDMWLPELVDEGRALTRAFNADLKSVLESAIPCTILGHRGLALNANAMFSSEAGHMMAEASETFGLVWRVGASGAVYCSLRSSGDYDVATIAQLFGGGGHRNAAGFETDLDTIQTFLGRTS